MNKNIIITLLSLMLLSCSHKQLNVGQFNKNGYEGLLLKTKAIVIDSLKNYSYVLQEAIKDEKYLAIKGKIADVFIKDSSYYVNVYKHLFGKNYLVHLRIITSNFNQFKTFLKFQSYKKQKGLFIIKLISYRVNDQSLLSDPEDANVVTYSDEGSIIIDGELVDYFIEK